MRRRYFTAAVFGLCLIGSLAGCAGATFTPTSNAHYPAWGDLVQIYDKPPPVAYLRIGMLSISGGWSASQDEMIETLKSAAGRQGANAIVLLGDRQLVDRNIFGMPEYSMSALAIRTVR
jgi:hypothetical protein